MFGTITRFTIVFHHFRPILLFSFSLHRDSEREGFPQTRQILEELGIPSFSTEDCRNLQYICSLVSRRAAFLASAGEIGRVNVSLVITKYITVLDTRFMMFWPMWLVLGQMYRPE